MNDYKETFVLYVELTQKGVEKYQSVTWPNTQLNKREDGSGFVRGTISKHDIIFFSNYFITYGENAIIKKPVELIKFTKEKLTNMLNQYD